LQQYEERYWGDWHQCSTGEDGTLTGHR
jgi:hypothetical protein